MLELKVEQKKNIQRTPKKRNLNMTKEEEKRKVKKLGNKKETITTKTLKNKERNIKTVMKK